ncbi:site-specific integrase [Campylobacter helveticus]|uniref:Site-specific integrase n=1 Tax=Campylobacter helveticus TaxID=28898 RepID=A0ABY3L473_9BACT|nr:site-specific integrase [Campylobacter helveticus]MCR2039111.1 site-specific integrase [Campylobacter helveticus]QBL11032.1 site-specific integrase [Campylobacter helveticus]TXK60904.1 site-specific integrase [Campylobacter helveticus]
MKHLPKNKNIYVYHNNKIYIDFFKNGKRVRKSTGLKHSALSFDFVRKNYEHFIQCFELEKRGEKLEAKKEIKALQENYFKLEDTFVEDKLLKEESKDFEEEKYSFIKVSEALLKEKAFLKGNTCIAYKSLQKSILSFLNKNKLYYLSDFKREHSLLFYNFLEEKAFSAKTIHSYCFFMKSLFNYALENDLLIKNPFFVPKVKQKLNTQEKESFKVFSLEEIICLIKNAKNDLRIFLILAFFTGARTGEILALKWEDLDFERNEIHIFKTLSNNGVLDSPKTKSSNRCVDMLELVKNELLPLKAKAYLGDFIINRGRYFLKKDFNALLEKLNYEKRRLYDTRHSFASIMLSKGEEPIWVGCKMMGHKDLNETYRTYAKYLPRPVIERASFLKGLDFSKIV